MTTNRYNQSLITLFFSNIIFLFCFFFYFIQSNRIENLGLYIYYSSLGLNLVCLPFFLYIKSSFLNEKLSLQLLSLLVLGIYCVIGFCDSEYLYLGLSGLAAFSYSYLWVDFFKSDEHTKDKWIFIGLNLIIGIGLFTALVGAKGWYYRNPLFDSYLISGAPGVSSDRIFHAAFSAMIKTYNMPSTGLNGVPYIPNHFLSHAIFGYLGKLFNQNQISFYTNLFAVVFVPYFFYQLTLLICQIRQFFGINTSLLKEHILWVSIWFVQFGILPFSIGKKIAVRWDNQFTSESYTLGLTLAFAWLNILLSVLPNKKPLSKIQLITFIVILPILMALIGFAKMSVMMVLCAGVGYGWLRLQLFRNHILTASLILTAILSLWAYKAMSLGITPEVQWLAFMSDYVPKELWWLHLLIFYSPTWVLIGGLSYFGIKPLTFPNIKPQLTGGILAEIILITTIVASLPSLIFRVDGGAAIYFSNVPQWVAFAIISALYPFWISKKRIVSFATIAILILMASIQTIGQSKYLIKNYKKARVTVTTTENLPQRKQLIDRLKTLQRLPIEEKQRSLLFIPREFSGYWSFFPNCRMNSFLAPAVTGIALLDGLPIASCPHELLGFQHYHDYRTRDNHKTPPVSVLCNKVRQKGFQQVILFSSKATTYHCGNAPEHLASPIPVLP